ncbi:hypothetical protein CANARDRAFT_194821 [[Candida] arabinofermentans NRRL YB-2248]|uniref:Elongation of fatty acids protein n=1 Tax=[Candida] arabinofermentans NRRL YB-2248 TaxID=983967 RepID=A0A1E4T713_9ASCO|nr:hypothetical protein CANARDRAFT_194821 [[Candida] arabinofermentans NRRL YB-2248]
MNTVDKLISWTTHPNSDIFKLPTSSKPISKIPFNVNSHFINDYFYPISLNYLTPLIISFIYFTSFHLLNKLILKRQINQYKSSNNGKLPSNSTPKLLKPAPFSIANWKSFKLFVTLHNVLLCIYSIWTFIGMLDSIYKNINDLFPINNITITNNNNNFSTSDKFWQTICDVDNGIWYNKNTKGLSFYSYLFYISKYYEIIDTLIIILKGKKTSLLQIYHHSGAILSMWSGTRFSSPPIWIFVVFNSFIHSIMYFYYFLSCLNIKIPIHMKKSLTILQILQFIIGGSLAITHLYINYFDLLNGSYKSCIGTSEDALAIFINVIYLAPLTLLFTAFYIDSYRKKVINSKKVN